MATISALKRRITAASNVSKTTKAMQMIAASKLKRSQNAALSSKTYVEKITDLSQGLNSKTEGKNNHPYLKKPEGIDRDLIIILSPDKGLCGGLLSNLTKELLNVDMNAKNPIYVTVGKKSERIVAKLQREIMASFDFGNLLPTFDVVYPIISLINDAYLNKKISSVKILSMRFVNVFSQSPKLTNILPLELPVSQSEGQKEEKEFSLFEPSVKELLPEILKRYLEVTVYQLFLESYAAEQAARMVAMQNATDNARDIIQSMQLEYNKKRQEKITNEILDIGSGTFAYV